MGSSVLTMGSSVLTVGSIGNGIEMFLQHGPPQLSSKWVGLKPEHADVLNR